VVCPHGIAGASVTTGLAERTAVPEDVADPCVEWAIADIATNIVANVTTTATTMLAARFRSSVILFNPFCPWTEASTRMRVDEPFLKAIQVERHGRCPGDRTGNLPFSDRFDCSRFNAY